MATSEGHTVAMTSPALRQLLDRARGPMGPAVQLDLGSATGPLAELNTVLEEVNGFFAFNAGVQVFRVGAEGLGYDLEHWNDPATWKDAYRGLADDLFCFGQDIFGMQFAIDRADRVVLMDPETGGREDLGGSLEEWAGWLLADPDHNGQGETALGWQDSYGALEVTERLSHHTPLVLGGEHTVDNVVVRDAVACLRLLGPVAVAHAGREV